MDLRIDIQFTFPDNDYEKDPTVDTSPSLRSPCGSEYTSITWKPTFSNSPPPTTAVIKLDKVEFFSTNDRNKQTPLEIGFLQNPTRPGDPNADGSLTIRFDETVPVPAEVDLLYTLHYNDPDGRHSELTFDPTLKVLPRGSGQPG